MAHPGYIMLSGSGAVGSTAYSTTGINFSLSNNSFIEYPLMWSNGISNSSTNAVAVSFWIKPATVASGELGQVIMSTVPMQGDATDNYIKINSKDTGGSSIDVNFGAFDNAGSPEGVRAISTGATSDESILTGQWNHVAFSISRNADTSISSCYVVNGQNISEFYVTYTSDNWFFDDTTTHDENTNFILGGRDRDASDGGAKDQNLNGDLADMWMDNNFVDFTSAATLATFRHPTGKPVQAPSGSRVYLRGNASTWANSGDGSIGTGVFSDITTSSTAPSD
jgi:hypothetical protein